MTLVEEIRMGLEAPAFGPGYEGAPLSFSVTDKGAIWFKGGAEVDQYIAEQFGADLEAAAAGQYDSWLAGGPLSALAGIILMDQLSRWGKGVRLFSAAAAAAEAAPGCEEPAKMLRMALNYMEAHRDIVARWGRFPHRNVILGRPSTAEEVAGLADGSIRTF
ncbi:hypothetical protein TSOC_010426 [Tetrabaena socialis]|uniref:Uncharacterized protein n=1 Tax=Tetrabaena socialis TaxID=47790 RepID=A0A2J7ZTA6_9CHLO|nr:hypothetical protein TSOC_010426 [Tetrabaena socialis]|eukprot:PNH03507.1 hypothetical protein TSOC_010426 [Tetrabaena socialis]